MEFQSEFAGERGLRLFVRGWEPDGRPRAVVALVHGLGEHTGRYAHVGARFVESRLALAGFDLRGHGQSDGRRGDTPSYEALMNDIGSFLELAVGRYPGLPLFLYGHSMGGNLVLNYALRRKPSLLGVIATGPWLALAFEPPAFQIALGRILKNILPSLSQSSGVDNGGISRDPDVVAAAKADPLCHSKITLREFFAIQESGRWALEHAGEFPLPLLLMHGTADRLTSLAASREFAQRAGQQVTFREWEGLYHEVHNEPEQAAVMKAMVDWMEGRLRK